MRSIVALRDFNGNPVSWYEVEEVTVPAPEMKKDVGHLILIIDRSGSMWGEKIRDAKVTVEKILTLAEFKDENLLVSLISYSSSGDVTTHFSRIRVSEVMSPGNSYVEQIRTIEATALTCASQAFEKALSLVGTEQTSIVLETDGYFNDPSPLAEKNRFDHLIDTASRFTNVTVTTVAFGGYADFNILTSIANRMSGRMVSARNTREVFDAVVNCGRVLTGNTVPCIQFHASTPDTYFAAVDYKQERILGASGTLSVRAVSDIAGLKVWSFRKLNPDDKGYGVEGVSGQFSAFSALSAFARAKLSEGMPTEAKYAVVSSRNSGLLSKHYKALTSQALAEFASDIESCVFGRHAGVFSAEYGLRSRGKSVIETLALLSVHRDDFTVDLDELHKTYKRRGLRRLAGSWVENKFVPVQYQARPADESTMLTCASIDLNNKNPTANMLFVRPAELVDVASGSVVSRVAGKKLTGNLNIFRYYTLIGDGEPNVDNLPIRISSVKLHKKLVDGGVIDSGDAFDHNKLYRIPLSQMSVVPFGSISGSVTPAAIRDLAHLKAVKSILSALKKEAPVESEWTEEQRAELSAHCLSEGLNFQPKTANPYSDQSEAIRNGWIDSRTSYEVHFGVPGLTSVDDLPSANAYFDRRFKCKYVGSSPPSDLKSGYAAKAKLPMLLDKDYQIEVKPTGKMTLTGVDDMLFPIYEAMVSTRSSDKIRIGSYLVSAGEGLASEIDQLSKNVEQESERLYDTVVRPVVFYTGSSGLIPDGYQYSTLSEEAYKNKYPSAKTRSGGTYYELQIPGAGEPVILTLVMSSAWFSTESGLKHAAELSAIEAD